MELNLSSENHPHYEGGIFLKLTHLPLPGIVQEGRTKFESQLQRVARCAEAGNLIGWKLQIPQLKRLAAKTPLSSKERSNLKEELSHLKRKLLLQARKRSLKASCYYFKKATELFQSGQLGESLKFFEKSKRLIKFGEKLGRQLNRTTH